MKAKKASARAWSGRVKYRGSESVARVLEKVLRQDREVQALTHGFHSYPARLHPEGARILVQHFGGPSGGVILDPFCGGGTIPLEAMRLGYRSIGLDLNPIAIEIARMRTMLRSEPWLDELEAKGKALAKGLRHQKLRPYLPPEVWKLRHWYQPEMLMELGALKQAIDRLKNRGQAKALSMVHSALVVKFSLRASETSNRRIPRIRKRYQALEAFEHKVEEWVRGWKALSQEVSRPSPQILLRQGDSRALTLPPEGKAIQADAIITSPPYPGIYDYLKLQQLRAAWLGIDLKVLWEKEHGSRGAFNKKGSKALKQWQSDIRHWMKRAAEVLNPGSYLVIAIGDGFLQGKELDPCPTYIREAKLTGRFEFVAQTSIERRHFLKNTKWEHILVWLRHQ